MRLATKTSKFAGRAALAVAGLWTASAPVHAQDGADVYKGRTITIVIGSSAGGGYDTYGRLLARHLGRHVPGAPQGRPANMPGAGSATAASHVANVGKDGGVIGIIFASVMVEPLLGDRTRIKLDPARLAFIGNANREVFMCAMRSSAPVKTIEDMRGREVVTGASATGGATVDFPLMLNRFLGAKVKIVRGYPGTREITLAIEKGELDGACGLAWSTTSVQYPRTLAEGQPLRIVLQETMRGHPVLTAAGIPVTGDLARNDAERQALALFYAQNEFGRPFVASADLPADRLAILRTAFNAAMKDPELLADAKRLNIDIIPSTGDDVQREVKRMYATPPEIVAEVRKALGQNN